MKIFTFCFLLLLSFVSFADSKQSILKRITPIGKVNVGPESTQATATAKLDGKKIYDTACVACHATGAAGAPKLEDKAAWDLRMKQGMDTMVQHVITGFNLMPPKGACAQCSDDDLRAAVEYMVK